MLKIKKDQIICLSYFNVNSAFTKPAPSKTRGLIKTFWSVSTQVGYQTLTWLILWTSKSLGNNLKAKHKVYSQIFASVKQITFHESNLQVRNEKKQHWCKWLTIYPPFYFNCALKGAWDSWGDTLLHFLIEPQGNC